MPVEVEEAIEGGTFPIFPDMAAAAISGLPMFVLWCCWLALALRLLLLAPPLFAVGPLC
jgi:hypothetical protein